MCLCACKCFCGSGGEGGGRGRGREEVETGRGGERERGGRERWGGKGREGMEGGERRKEERMQYMLYCKMWGKEEDKRLHLHYCMSSSLSFTLSPLPPPPSIAMSGIQQLQLCHGSGGGWIGICSNQTTPQDMGGESDCSGR